MSFTTVLWQVEGDRLVSVNRSRLDSERQLEDWLVTDPSLLGRDLVVIGRQIRTLSGPLDILAIDSDGDVVVVELKRDRTPREVVAQVLDYASWIRSLKYEDFDRICQEFHCKPLSQVFESQFQFSIPETVGTRHSLLIVAAELDESSERIVQYLQQEHDVNINAVYFTTFDVDGRKLLARSWLADPVETTDRIEAKRKSPWSGLWFINNGAESWRGRDWEACRKLGFISAGGGLRYSDPLYKLEEGARIVAYHSGRGYVGYGIVSGPAVPASEFRLSDGTVLSDVLTDLDPNRNDLNKREHALPVRWISTVPVDAAKWFKGAFAKPHIVCKLRHEPTVQFLMREFGIGA